MEGSKAFAKEFMARWKIPTAASRTFDVYEDAKSYVDSVAHRIVIKADGLYVQFSPSLSISHIYSHDVLPFACDV